MSNKHRAKSVAVLLVNLGSPTASTVWAVAKFLKEFLSDRRVVNLPRLPWWFILHFFVLPLRPWRSVRAYRKIWQKKGSPLIFLTRQLTEKVARQLPTGRYQVNYAMSYGQPSIQQQLSQFCPDSIDTLVVIPLYPQYSSTTTASVYDAVSQVLQSWRYIPSIQFISDYHQHPDYIEAIAKSIQQVWKKQPAHELLLLSFHGLPAKLTEWGDPYFEQCQQTAKLIAQRLNLSDQRWKLVFQSRFGKAQWLQPYCQQTLETLPQQGIKHIDIVCPGFAVDCLETLEEIAVENKAIFLQAGGKSYRYIPALNDSNQQAKLMASLVLNQ